MLANLLDNSNFEATTVSPWVLNNSVLSQTDRITGSQSMLIKANGWIRQPVSVLAGTYNISFRMRSHDGVANYVVRFVNPITGSGNSFTMDFKNIDALHDAGANPQNEVRRVNGQYKVSAATSFLLEIKNQSSSLELMVDDICLWKTFDQFPSNGHVRQETGWSYYQSYAPPASTGVLVDALTNVDFTSPLFPVKAGVYYKVIVDYVTEGALLGTVKVKFNNQGWAQVWSSSSDDFPYNAAEIRDVTFRSNVTMSNATVNIAVSTSKFSGKLNLRFCRVYEIEANASSYVGLPNATTNNYWTNLTYPNAANSLNTYTHPVAKLCNPDFAGDCTGKSGPGVVYQNTSINAPVDGSWYAVSLAMGDYAISIDDEKVLDCAGYSNDHTVMIKGAQNIKLTGTNYNGIISYLDVRKVDRNTTYNSLIANSDFLEGYANWTRSAGVLSKKVGRSINMELDTGATLQQVVTLPVGAYRVVSRTTDGSASKTQGMNVKRGTIALANRAAMPSADGHTSFNNTVAGSITFTLTSNAGLNVSGIHVFPAPNYTDRPKNNDFSNGQSFWMPFTSYNMITPDDYDCYAQLLAGQYIDSYSSGCNLTASKAYVLSIMNRSTGAIQVSVTVGSTVLVNQSLSATGTNWQARTISFNSGSSAGNAVVRITAAATVPSDIKYISVSL